MALRGFTATAWLLVALACGGSHKDNGSQNPDPQPGPPPATVRPIDVLAGSAGGQGAIDGSASEARFKEVAGLCLDNQGRLLVADLGLIRRVDPATGAATTWGGVLGGPQTMMDGYLSEATFDLPNGMAMASDGTLYLTDLGPCAIRKVDPTGLVTSILPGGSSAYSDGVGANVRFNMPTGLALDESKDVLYVADSNNQVIRRVNLDTLETTTLAGVYGAEETLDGPFETAHLNRPMALALGEDDILYVGCADTVRRLDLKARRATTLAGLAGAEGFADGFGSQAKFHYISGLCLDGMGHLLLSEGGVSGGYCGQIVRSLDLASGEVHTLAGTGSDLGDEDGVIGLTGCVDGVGGSVRFSMPFGIVSDGRGTAYITDMDNFVIRKMDLASGKVTTLSGVRPQMGSVDGPAAQAAFKQPVGITRDAAGNVYLADQGNQQIRKVSPQGIVSTVAGLPHARGFADGPASMAKFSSPSDVAVDPKGNLFVVDFGNHCIRKITPEGVVSTFAGTPEEASLEDGPGASAKFSYPQGILMASDGNLYVCDSGNSVIRRILPDGTVSTFAGSGATGMDDGPLASATFNSPTSVAEDRDGHLYVADAGNNAIRVIDPAAGVVTTVAGGYPGSVDGQGTEARFNGVFRIAVDAKGDVLVGDVWNNAIRKVTPSGAVSTVVGRLLDGGPSLSGIKLGDLPGQITMPEGLCSAPDGSLLVLSDNCVLKITGIQ